jgi:hypothetical protein
MTLGSGPTPWLAGMTGTFTFTLSSTNALPGSITFTYAQLPAGASISLNPSSVTLGPSSTATVTATIATLPTDNGGVAGNFSPVITATAGPAAHSLTVPVLLQDFGLTLSKQRQDVPCAGGALTLELSSPGVNGYDTTNQPVTLSFYGFFVTPIAVPGTGLSLGSASIVQDTNTLVVSVSVGPQYCGTEQIYYAALRGYSGGYSGGVNHYAWAEVHINSPSAHQADFTVAVSPPSQTLATPGLTAYPISVSAAWGFGSPVNLVVSGAPAGATAYFAQSGTGQVSFNIVGGSPGRPTLVVTTTASTPAGTYPLTITASGGGVAHTATATLVVGQSTAQSYIVSASQPGFSITLDDTGYTTPQTRQWQSGEQHTVSALSTQNDGSGNPYDFSDWSDGGAQTHSVIGGTAQPAITARYSPRVPLPSPISVVPYFGTGSAQTFTATYTDPHGASAITQALLSIQATAGITASQCIMRYDPGPGNLYLKADDGVALLGPIAAGGLDTLSNSQCVLSGGSNGTASGNNLSVNFAVIFTTSFTGTKQLILQALEASVAGRAVPLGTWTVPVPGSGPTTGVTGGTPPGPDDSSPTPTATPPSVQTNSAPNCNDITGTWTDPFGDVYSLRQTGSSVTGTISEPDPYCLYNVIWQVQG